MTGARGKERVHISLLFLSPSHLMSPTNSHCSQVTSPRGIFLKVKALSSLRGGAVGGGYSSPLARLAHVIAQVLTLPKT